MDIKHRYTGKIMHTARVVEGRLHRLYFGREDLRNADLSGASLHRANMVDAKLQGADLSNADLSGADLDRADLTNADLRRANLRGADLRGANLRGANLFGANLTDADLRGADIHGAGLSCPIVRIEGLKWGVMVVGGQMRIGCQCHTIAEWEAFSDSDIHSMDIYHSLAFWNKHKTALLTIAKSLQVEL